MLKAKVHDVDDVLEAYLRNRAFEATEAYVGRGRSLAGIETQELKDRWVKAFQLWVRAFQLPSSESIQLRLEDIESELLIRSEALPYGQVQQEKAALAEAARVLHAELQQDPDRLEKLREELQEGLEAFWAKSKEAH